VWRIRKNPAGWPSLSDGCVDKVGAGLERISASAIPVPEFHPHLSSNGKAPSTHIGDVDLGRAISDDLAEFTPVDTGHTGSYRAESPYGALYSELWARGTVSDDNGVRRNTDMSGRLPRAFYTNISTDHG
jgi:hypothetical protein